MNFQLQPSETRRMMITMRIFSILITKMNLSITEEVIGGELGNI